MTKLVFQEKKEHLEDMSKTYKVEIINNENLSDSFSVSKNNKKIYLMNY